MQRGSSLIVVGDDKAVRILRIQGRAFFMDFADASAPRSAFQRAAKLTEFTSGADGIDLYPAVPQVAGVAAQMQALGNPLREVAVTDTLNCSRDKKPLGLIAIGHKRGNCSRGRI